MDNPNPNPVIPNVTVESPTVTINNDITKEFQCTCYVLCGCLIVLCLIDLVRCFLTWGVNSKMNNINEKCKGAAK
jgi:hypothetical protein